MHSVEIREVKNNKKEYLSLLLLADEQENMIDRYLDRGIMYVLEDDGIKSECVVTAMKATVYWKSKILQRTQSIRGMDMEKRLLPF